MPSSAFYRRRAERATTRRERAAFRLRATEEEICERIRSCQACQLGEISDENRWERVPFVGGRNPVAIVGEAPGRDEALQGEPFVGRAGDVLNQGIEHAGLARSQTTILNTIACRPPKNQFQVAEDVGAPEACRTHFNAQLDHSGAWLVVLVGKKAYLAVMEEDVPLHKVRGRIRYVGGRFYLPTWHPAYVLRKGVGSEEGEQFFSDWEKVGAALRGERILPTVKISEVLGSQLALHAPHERMQERIERNGWVRIHSDLLDGTMVVVDDWKRVRKLPQTLQEEPIWTTDELVRLGFGDAAGATASKRELRKIQLLKETVGCQVVV